jgi:hypothetical protein
VAWVVRRKDVRIPLEGEPREGRCIDMSRPILVVNSCRIRG